MRTTHSLATTHASTKYLPASAILIAIAAVSTAGTAAAQTADQASVYQSTYQIADRTLAPAASQAPTHNLTPTQSNFPALTPSDDPGQGRADEAKTKDSGFAGPAVTVSSSLAVVLGLFAGLVWLTRKFNKQTTAGGQLSSDVFEHLGSVPIDPRTRICLMRCGTRVLVIAQSASGMQPLSEITEPEEVRHLVALCKGSSSEEFAQTLQAIQNEKTKPGFLGDQPASTEAAASKRTLGRLFATS